MTNFDRYQNLMLFQALKQDLLNNNESVLHNWVAAISNLNDRKILAVAKAGYQYLVPDRELKLEGREHRWFASWSKAIKKGPFFDRALTQNSHPDLRLFQPRQFLPVF
ncbi:hypothetical protein H6F90_11695 [Trichocoleus sp. FACHB-591]|uniref:hypothetical protein n=1 Tax=Trichocoleus sp. FACHB-591 TaxID=2692872 RepID=UPI001689C1DF|nr:hypothetical protein [Trichocoleus sp. FACHB-591]MBD2095811.1 hypothetical protein [Trichocoleus sp. FACHB-591]